MARKPVLEGGKRDELIDAALELFFENGYENTSIRMIASRVGCEVGLFYYYFKNKDEAFSLAIDRFFSRYEGKLEELVCRAQRDPYRIMTDMFYAISGETERFRACYAGRLHWTVRWAIRERTLQALEPYMLRLVKALCGCGMRPRLSPEATAVFLTHGVGSTILHESREEYADRAAELRRGVELLMGIPEGEAELFSPYYAGFGDIPALTELFSREKALFPQLAQSGERLLPARISEKEVFVLRAGRQLAGAALFSRRGKTLEAVITAPGYRRQGCAERLTVSALAQFRAGEEIFVPGDVSDGSPAEGLLKKFGLHRFREGQSCIIAPEKFFLSHMKHTAEEQKHA